MQGLQPYDPADAVAIYPRLAGGRGKHRAWGRSVLGNSRREADRGSLAAWRWCSDVDGGHPIIACRTWLWRAKAGAVIEALGFASTGAAGAGGAPEKGKVGRDWLAALGIGPVQEVVAGPAADSPTSGGPVLAWAVSRPLAETKSALSRQAARFSAAPLAGITSRATLAALLEAYLGRRGAAQVLARRSRREIGETIRAVLLFGDLRGFAKLCRSPNHQGSGGQAARLVRPHRWRRSRVRRRGAEIHRRRCAGYFHDRRTGHFSRAPIVSANLFGFVLPKLVDRWD